MHGLINEKLQETKPKLHDALIMSEALAFSLRYQAVMMGFEEIFDRVGYTPGPAGRQLSSKIVLRNMTNELGEGKLVANLITGSGLRLVYSDVTTTVRFETVSGDAYQVTEERFHGQRFPVSIREHTGILDDQSGMWPFWDEGSFGQGRSLSPVEKVQLTWQSIGPVIDDAETTQLLLWQAIDDPALNPDFAKTLTRHYS